ncbi:hypothetical protein [Streptomyces tibetensis]|uniref:hypothetical protein n=1 Tax=Streptomyces tibetensis TaxID=2382123 RepID=UPI0033CEA739
MPGTGYGELVIVHDGRTPTDVALTGRSLQPFQRLLNREITEAQRTECRARLATLKPLLARRNHLVHGMWWPERVPETEPLPSAAWALVSKRRTAAASIEISYEDAETLAFELNRAGSGVFDWICRSLLVQLRREQVTEPPEEVNGGGG